MIGKRVCIDAPELQMPRLYEPAEGDTVDFPAPKTYRRWDTVIEPRLKRALLVRFDNGQIWLPAIGECIMFSYRPIQNLSPFSIRSKSERFMALKSFYDGSGQSDNLRSPYVTLAGFIADEDGWKLVESSWGDVLKAYPMCPRSQLGNPYFHSCEAFNFTEGYRGWDDKQVTHLALDLLNVLAGTGKQSLVGFSCTVSKQDYASVKNSHIPALRDINAICIDHCIGHSFFHRERDAGIEIFFDRHEKFEPILKSAWNAELDGKRASWAHLVLSIGAIDDMRYSYAIQAADVLAWSANRYYTHGADDKFGRYMFMLHLINPQYHAFYNKEAIMSV